MGSRALISLGALAAALAVVAGVIAPPAHPLAVVALGALTIGLALHGLGRAAGWLIADHDAPVALAIAWGLAVYLALGGALAALGCFDRRAQIALALIGVGLGALWIARRHAELAARARRWRPDADTLVAIGAALLVAVHVLGGAGARHGGFVDGDGDLLGPLARLAQTGALPDAIGGPRGSGLGGSVIATSLGWVLGDWRASHAIDGGLGLALALALALGLRGPGAGRPYLGVAIAALAIGLPALPPDLAPRWITVALVLATYASLGRARAAPLAVVTAAGVAAITHGGLGLLIAIVLAEAGRRRPRAALAIAALAGYLIALVRARAAAAAAPSLIAPGLALRAAIAAATAAVLWALLSAATRRVGDRALAILIAAAAVAIGASIALSTSLVAGGLAAAPIAMAAVLAIAVVGLDALRPPLPPLAVVAAFALALALGGLRFKLGVPPRSWGDREADLIDAAREHLGAARGPDPGEAAAYRAAQGAIPAGARVGLWVDRADLLDYRRHALFDLRTADTVACRAPAPRRALARPSSARCRALAALPAGLRLDYLVLAPSAAIDPADPIRALAVTGHTLAATGDLIVVELRP